MICLAAFDYWRHLYWCQLQIPLSTEAHCEQHKQCKKWLDNEDTDEMNATIVTADRKQVRKAGNTPLGDGPLSGLLFDPAVHQSILDRIFHIRNQTDDK